MDRCLSAEKDVSTNCIWCWTNSFFLSLFRYCTSAVGFVVSFSSILKLFIFPRDSCYSSNPLSLWWMICIEMKDGIPQKLKLCTIPISTTPTAFLLWHLWLHCLACQRFQLLSSRVALRLKRPIRKISRIIIGISSDKQIVSPDNHGGQRLTVSWVEWRKSSVAQAAAALASG